MTIRSFRSVALIFSFGLLLASQAYSQTEKDDSSNVIASYSVSSLRLEGTPAKDHQAIWNSVKALIPPSLLSQVDKVELFQIPQEFADQPTGTDGYASLNEDGLTFTLGLNIETAMLPDFPPTLIHEFGHVLSLQASQRDENAVGTLVLDEGTLAARSYLNSFYERFWKTQYPGRGAETTSEAEGSALYAKSPSSFVTEYAATGPLEDFAETFAFFVTGAKPSSKTLKDQKLSYFWSQPELVKLRDQIRVGLKP